MMEMWDNVIRIELPTINCGGIDFYSMEDAGNHFGISSERVRQKLKSDKHSDWIYLDN